MYYVYILQLSDGKFYTGFSSDLKQRINTHKKNLVSQTKGKSPELMFYASFQSKSKALAFEKYLKSSSGNAFRNKRLV